MFWTIVEALFFFFVILPIIFGLMMHKEFWYFIAGILGILMLIVVIILLKTNNEPKFPTTPNISYDTSYTQTNVSETNRENVITPVVKNLNEKCVTEDTDLKICDLKFSSNNNTNGYRDLFVEGNEVACVDMSNGEVTKNGTDSLQASSNASFCATDFGFVYIDPTLQVTKHYGSIIQKDYSSPYVIPNFYDTCLWAYEDGNGSIPYLEVLGNIGNRSGFNVAAFCKNGKNQVDIYTSKY